MNKRCRLCEMRQQCSKLVSFTVVKYCNLHNYNLIGLYFVIEFEQNAKKTNWLIDMFLAIRQWQAY